ncbi:MAG: carbonate dehydratase [Phycisphaerae bacterium]
MRFLPKLFENNRQWAAQVTQNDPAFFSKLAALQEPDYLWIGCADSRVPANQIIGLNPGEIFVHRNIANVVPHTDFNCLSVIEYAVAVLKVNHIIVCGHYGCGGVAAALQSRPVGLIDNWLRHIRDVRAKHAEALDAIDDDRARLDRLCELNVIEQVNNVCHTSIVQRAWDEGHSLAVHGWIYRLNDGLLQDLHVVVNSATEIADAYRVAVEERSQFA